MRFHIRFVSVCLAALLLTVLLPGALAADSHVVKSRDLHQALLDASGDRQENVSKIEEFLSTEQARQALKSFGIDPGRVSHAIPMLSDEELAQLASKTEEMQADFAGGLSDRTMLYILIIVAVGSLIALLIAMP